MKLKKLTSFIMALALMLAVFPMPQAKAASERLPDGSYYIVTALDPNKVLDIYCMGSHSGANLQIYQLNNCGAQRFRVTYSNGYYTIINEHSGKALDVQGGGTASGTNVWQYEVNGTDAQKWSISWCGNGFYTIKAKCGKYLDVQGGSSANDTNIWIYDGNGTKAQQFRFIPVSQPVSNGDYVIASALNTDYVLDISGGSSFNKANVQLYNRNHTDAQTFKLTFSNGYYSIVNRGSGRAVNLANGSTQPGTNVYQYTNSGSSSQKWSLVPDGNGYYYLVNQNGLYMKAASTKVKNGTNICASTGMKERAYKFKLIPLDRKHTITYDTTSYAAWLNSSKTFFTLSEHTVITGVRVTEYGTVKVKVPSQDHLMKLQTADRYSYRMNKTTSSSIISGVAPDFSWASKPEFDPYSSVPGTVYTIKVPSKVEYTVHTHTYNSGFGRNWIYRDGGIQVIQTCNCGLRQDQIYWEIPLPDITESSDTVTTQKVIKNLPRVN